MTDHERFINYLRFEKRSSEHTVIAYENDLKQYADYLGIQYQLIDLTQSSHFIIRSWIVSLMEAGLDPRSVNRKITTLRTFYRFMVKTGRLERSPMIKVMAPKTKKKLPEYEAKQKQ